MINIVVIVNYILIFFMIVIDHRHRFRQLF